MHQINVSDELFANLQQWALEDGFSSVDEYVADVLIHHLQDPGPDMDQFFTPERMAEIQQSRDEVDAGNFFTLEQSKKELAKVREKWLAERPDAK